MTGRAVDRLAGTDLRFCLARDLPGGRSWGSLVATQDARSQLRSASVVSTRIFDSESAACSLAIGTIRFPHIFWPTVQITNHHAGCYGNRISKLFSTVFCGNLRREKKQGLIQPFCVSRTALLGGFLLGNFPLASIPPIICCCWPATFSAAPSFRNISFSFCNSRGLVSKLYLAA